MVARYDLKNRIPDIASSAYLKLAKTGDAGYHIPKSSSLSTKKVGPYKILQQVSPLAYRLELPPSMSSIHPVISVIHLEQGKADLFGRTIPPPALVVIQGREEYVVAKILRRELRGRKHGDQVKWKGYNNTTLEPATNLKDANIFRLLHLLYLWRLENYRFEKAFLPH